MDELTGRKKFFSATAENAVLGAMLIDAGCVPDVLDRLRADEFYIQLHQRFFESAQALFYAGKPVDAVTILAELRERGYTQDDLPGFAAELMRNTPTAANVLEYAQIVHEQARLRAMRAAAAAVLQAPNLDEASAAAEGLVACLSDERVAEKRTAQEAAALFWQRYNNPRSFVEWGLEPLDSPCTHTSLGDFVILGGYPGAGKSMLALQLAQHLARKYRVCYFSVEMSSDDIDDRAFARASGVPLDVIQEQRGTAAQVAALSRASEEYYKLRFDTVNAAGKTVAQIEAETMAGRYQVIVVDYMQILSAPGAGRFDKVTEISIGLRNLAKKRHVLVLALSQLARLGTPREGKPTPPDMFSLRESGQLEQDADLIWLLYLDNPNNPKSRRVLKTAKNRKATRAPTCYLCFDGDRQTFSEQFPERQRPQPRDGKKKPGADPEQEELPL